MAYVLSLPTSLYPSLPRSLTHAFSSSPPSFHPPLVFSAALLEPIKPYHWPALHGSLLTLLHPVQLRLPPLSLSLSLSSLSLSLSPLPLSSLRLSLSPCPARALSRSPRLSPISPPLSLSLSLSLSLFLSLFFSLFLSL